MKATLHKREQHRQVPWKNGKGQTAEIAIFPHNADFARDLFLWRVSTAPVTASGPFSAFPGYERHLALLEGKSLVLNFERSGRKETLKPGKAIRFPGDEAVQGELPSGPVTDLNLIVRPGEVRAAFHVLDIASPRSFELEGRAVFVIGMRGATRVSVYPGEQKFSLKQADALRLERVAEQEEPVILLEAAKEGDVAQVALIELDW